MDKSLDSSSYGDNNDKVKVDENYNVDLNDLNENLNNLVQELNEEDIKATKVTEDDQVEEDVKINLPIPPNVDASSKYSRFPGFEHMKRSSTHISQCSTSFVRHHKKNIRGISIIHELEKSIEIRNSLGLNVSACTETLSQND